MAGPRATDRFATAADRLAERFGEHVPAETIRRVLHDTYEALQATATITAYLPVLAERSAAARLAVIARGRGDPSAAGVGTAHSVALRGGAAAWRNAIEVVSEGRWRCVDGPADVVVVTPADDWSPGDTVVVADHRESPPACEIAAACDRGATAYVCRAEPVVVVAYLDALARRLPAFHPADAVECATRGRFPR